MPTRAEPLSGEGRTAREGIEKACLPSGRRPDQALVPIAKEASELLLEGVKRGYLEIHGGEAMAHQLPNLSAGSSAALSFPQDSSELIEREPHEERAANEENARQRLRRIATISARRPRGKCEQPLALVVTKGVGADSGTLRQLARPERPRLTFHRLPTFIESPVS